MINTDHGTDKWGGRGGVKDFRFAAGGARGRPRALPSDGCWSPGLLPPPEGDLRPEQAASFSRSRSHAGFGLWSVTRATKTAHPPTVEGIFPLLGRNVRELPKLGSSCLTHAHL